MGKTKISLVIITRNRYLLLLNLLASIVSQNSFNGEVVVIDNASTDHTRELVTKLKDKFSFPLNYYYVSPVGRAAARNEGIRLAKHNWVAFIDDDCVLKANWYQRFDKLLSSEKNKKKRDVIVGQCFVLNKKNIFAVVQYLFEENWKLNGRNLSKIINYGTLDTKNIIFNKYFLTANDIIFDESLPDYGIEKSEDFDLGLKVLNNGGNVYFDHGIGVEHRYAENLKDYLLHFWNNTKETIRYRRRVKKTPGLLNKNNNSTFAFAFDNDYFKNSSFLVKSKILAVIIFTVIYLKSIKIILYVIT